MELIRAGPLHACSGTAEGTTQDTATGSQTDDCQEVMSSQHDSISRDITATLDRLPAEATADDAAIAATVRGLLAIKRRAGLSATAFMAELAPMLAQREQSGILDQRLASLILARVTSGDEPPHPVDERHDLLRLQQIVQAASSSTPLPARLSGITHLVTAAMQMDGCTLFVRDEPTDVLALRAACGMDPATVGAVTLRVGHGIVGKAAAERRTVRAPDAPAHASFVDHPGLTDELFASQLSTPLIVGDQDRLVGVISVHTLAPRTFRDDDVELLETVAGVLAIAIDSSRQSARTDIQLRQKVSELGTLQRVSRVIASTLDLSEVLKLITEQAVELIQAEAASIFQLPGDNSHSERRPGIAYRIGRIRSHENEADRDTIVNEVLRTGAARTSNITYQDGSTSTVFCLPLNTARETVGALCFRLRHDTTLDEEKLGLLQAFSDAAAIAIDNARLYQDAITSIQTQSALVQEMHHRVRNNLQTVAALLSLQLRSEENAPWGFELREAIGRIQAIAGVHDLMSDESRLAGTTVDVIARMVAEDAHSTLTPPDLSVRFEIPRSALKVPSKQATIIALLINELTANAIHHGFRDRRHGRITITAWEDDGSAVIEVANDGAQIPAGFDPATSTGLGMRITQRLVASDLRGTFTIVPTAEGTLATIRFPIAALNA